MFNLTFAYSTPTCTILILHTFEIRRDEPFHKNKISQCFLQSIIFFMLLKLVALFSLG